MAIPKVHLVWGRTQTFGVPLYKQQQVLEAIIQQQRPDDGEPNPDLWSDFVLYPRREQQKQNPHYWAAKAADLRAMRSYGTV